MRCPEKPSIFQSPPLTHPPLLPRFLPFQTTPHPLLLFSIPLLCPPQRASDPPLTHVFVPEDFLTSPNLLIDLVSLSRLVSPFKAPFAKSPMISCCGTRSPTHFNPHGLAPDLSERDLFSLGRGSLSCYIFFILVSPVPPIVFFVRLVTPALFPFPLSNWRPFSTPRCRPSGLALPFLV